MKKLKCSCGTSWMPTWLKVQLSRRFEEACLQHDLDYESTLSQREADIRFFENMLKITPKLTHRVKWTLFACFYYWALRLGGKFAYKAAQNKRKG